MNLNMVSLWFKRLLSKFILAPKSYCFIFQLLQSTRDLESTYSRYAKLICSRNLVRANIRLNGSRFLSLPVLKIWPTLAYCICWNYFPSLWFPNINFSGSKTISKFPFTLMYYNLPNKCKLSLKHKISEVSYSLLVSKHSHLKKKKLS